MSLTMQPSFEIIIPGTIFRAKIPLVQSLPAALLASLVFLIFVYRRVTAWRVTPKGVPWITDELPAPKHHKRSLSRVDALPLPNAVKHIRGHSRDLKEGVNLVSAGYEKFSKNNTPFVAPSFTDWHGEVVLPPAQFSWLANQPEQVLSIEKAIAHSTEFPYTTPATWEFSKPFHVEAISKIRVESCMAEVQEEMKASIDRHWGVDTERWTSVGLQPSLREVLVQINARVFYGDALAHDETFLANASAFISNISYAAVRVSLIPEVLKPMLARFETRRLHKWNEACVKFIQPLVERVVKAEDIQPRTLLETLSRIAAKSDQPIDRDPFNISSRLLAAHYVAAHTSTHTVINALLDILSPEAQADGVLDAISEEIQTVSSTLPDDQWTKLAVSRLVILDSAIRESMRLHPFKARGLTRVVAKSSGVTLPSGQHLPQGSKVGVPSLAVHEDEDIYRDAKRYDAFRFCRQSSGDASKKGMVNPSETFLSFGLGRHACPGRHLATYQLKMILAYILQNYEVRGLEGGRPQNLPFSDFCVTPPQELEVRRRIRQVTPASCT